MIYGYFVKFEYPITKSYSALIKKWEEDIKGLDTPKDGKYLKEPGTIQNNDKESTIKKLKEVRNFFLKIVDEEHAIIKFIDKDIKSLS